MQVLFASGRKEAAFFVSHFTVLWGICGTTSYTKAGEYSEMPLDV
jgi:hypothetical protein